MWRAKMGWRITSMLAMSDFEMGESHLMMLLQTLQASLFRRMMFYAQARSAFSSVWCTELLQ